LDPSEGHQVAVHQGDEADTFDRISGFLFSASKFAPKTQTASGKAEAQDYHV